MLSLVGDEIVIYPEGKSMKLGRKSNELAILFRMYCLYYTLPEFISFIQTCGINPIFFIDSEF